MISRISALIALLNLIGSDKTLCAAFVAPSLSQHTSRHRVQSMSKTYHDESLVYRHRREGLLNAIAAMVCLVPLTCLPLPSNAAISSNVPGTVWLTGKYPQIPGQKPHEKSDVKGTRRDPSFLRSISDCKSQCERNTGADGLARAKEDCLSECQDICCDSYEQCTFAIVPRI
ncbi:hypothetical protein MPSEU_000377900 [Mayamaea pseudoterrestris]|nr:hypothetical protein MPSEU_000377900 [Mayamaea pseudoterrestris]